MTGAEKKDSERVTGCVRSGQAGKGSARDALEEVRWPEGFFIQHIDRLSAKAGKR